MGSTDERFMLRALELALGPPFTSPNPRVGAVVVREGRVLAEAAHLGAGTRHAEALALERADETAGATVYVTLEPCTHHGLTPPCVPALIEAGLDRVVIAILDPDPRVSGAGVEALTTAGIEVTTGVLADEAERANAPYLHQRRTGRAYLTLKLALTLDGRLGAADGTSRWITGRGARERVHRRRLEADAVMVGSGTVALDDPSLNVRAIEAPRQPTAVVVDSSGTTEPGASVFREHTEVIVATHPSAAHEQQVAWKEAGAEVLVLPAPPGVDEVDVAALLDELGRRGMLEVYCEGGARLATRLLALDLVDRLELHHGAALIGEGGPSIGDLGASTMDDASRWKLAGTEVLEDDVVTTYLKAGG